MLQKGRENIKWDGEEIFAGEEKPAKAGEVKWYDTINYDIFHPPFCVRPKGRGMRFDFLSFGNLRDKALEIKEAAPYKFKHTGDVDRNAHYIGMYILEALYVKNKKFTIQDEVEASIAPLLEDGELRKFLRFQFQRFFDQFAIGVIPEEVMVAGADSIASKIENKDVLQWFIKDCEAKMNSEKEIEKARNKIRMREARATASDLGMKVIDGKM